MDDGANDSCDVLCCIHRHVCTTVLGTAPSHRHCTGVCEWDDEMLSYSLKRASTDAEATRDEEGGCHDYVMGVGITQREAMWTPQDLLISGINSCCM